MHWQIGKSEGGSLSAHPCRWFSFGNQKGGHRIVIKKREWVTKVSGDRKKRNCKAPPFSGNVASGTASTLPKKGKGQVTGRSLGKSRIDEGRRDAHDLVCPGGETGHPMPI